ncbi:MAG: DUF4330 family protein [Ruminococcaceae bacterium]|nr:DUF4330 family protein [Oscillospiraceae bacterium]
MKNKENAKKGGRVSALDVFIAVLVLMCIAGVIVRVYVGSDGILPVISPELSEYAVSFEVKQAKASVSGYLSAGESLWTEDGTLFGTVSDNITVTPAQIFVEDSDGKYVSVYSSADIGDNSLVDIKGAASVQGYTADYGFLVNGKTYIAPNFEIELHTEKATVTVIVTGISKVVS